MIRSIAASDNTKKPDVQGSSTDKAALPAVVKSSIPALECPPTQEKQWDVQEKPSEKVATVVEQSAVFPNESTKTSLPQHMTQRALYQQLRAVYKTNITTQYVKN